MARGQNSQGQGCTEYLGSVGQHQIPTPGDPRVGGGAALLTAPRGAGPRQEPHPCACSTRPSHQGSLSHGSGQAGAQHRQSSSGQPAGVRRWRHSVDGQDRRTHSAAGCCLRTGSPRKAGPSC